jgi:hypothetical protein
MTAAVTAAALAVGKRPRTTAAYPATCGAAIDVPSSVLLEISESIPAAVMLTPGAKISTHVPRFEKLA